MSDGRTDMKIINTTYQDGKDKWDQFISRHEDTKLKDIFLVYTYHYQNVVTKEFATYDEIDKEWGDDWDFTRIEFDYRTKRSTPYIYTKHRIMTLFKLDNKTHLEILLKKKETKQDVYDYTDIGEDWDKELKEYGYNSFIFEWVDRSW